MKSLPSSPVRPSNATPEIGPFSNLRPRGRAPVILYPAGQSSPAILFRSSKLRISAPFGGKTIILPATSNKTCNNKRYGSVETQYCTRRVKDRIGSPPAPATATATKIGIALQLTDGWLAPRPGRRAPSRWRRREGRGGPRARGGMKKGLTSDRPAESRVLGGTDSPIRPPFPP